MHPYHRQIDRIRHCLRGGRIAGALAGTAALAAGLLLAFGLADAFAAFEPAARTVFLTIIVVAVGAALLVALGLALRVPRPRAAALADDALGDPRRPASAALSLDPASAETPLAQLLTRRALDEAARSLHTLPARRVVPWRVPLHALGALAVPLLVIGLLAALRPDAFRTVAGRMLHPRADIPPYSNMGFVVEPAKPQVVYGGELLVSAEITGGKSARPVECLVRLPRTGALLRLPAFRETDTRFSRKLDGLTEPVEIAFACGKARSVWHPVEILLEPGVVGAVVRLTPPEHTGLAASEFPLDTNEIAAIEGSTVTLELTSNRPLGSGKLALTPASAPGVEAAEHVVDAEISGPRTASFTWLATTGGRVSATVRDLRGTPSPRPLELAFRCVPDQAPVVTMMSPPPMMLATPTTRIPLAGRAEDDFALSKVRLVRTLAGFRDRSRVIAPALNEREFELEEAMNLYDIGLEAGQTIELALEAADHNPSLLGQGSSEISRIRIISEDEYAEYIRARTTVREFESRFRAVREALDDVREKLEDLRRKIEEGTPEDVAQAAEAAAEANAKAAELLEKIAKDFSAFEIEKRLMDLAGEMAEELQANIDPLRQRIPQAPRDEQRKAIDEMLRRLGKREEERKQLDDDIALMRQAAAIMEMAAEFRRIYDNQVSVVKRLHTIVKELQLGDDTNRRMLPLLGDTQRKNREALDDFARNLRSRAEAVPEGHPELVPLVDSALAFLHELEVADPGSLMDAASGHAEAGRALPAYDNAELARAALERLMSGEGAFQDAIRGKAPAFNIPRPDVNETLQQLLEGMLGRNQGQGRGNAPGGQGAGPGGMGADGMPGGGFPMDLPVAGPERLRFSDAGGGKGGRGGEGRATSPLPGNAESGSIRPDETRDGEAPAADPETIPEPYRDAVKRFLTP